MIITLTPKVVTSSPRDDLLKELRRDADELTRKARMLDPKIAKYAKMVGTRLRRLESDGEFTADTTGDGMLGLSVWHDIPSDILEPVQIRVITDYGRDLPKKFLD